MNPSEEQQTIIDAVKEGFNVQVDAVAGSGKTTTILSMADQMSDKRMIQLTYNAELKDEVNAKKDKYNTTMDLDNLSIYTYHGLATKFYTQDAKRDIGISRIVQTDMRPRRKLPPIDILAMDEIQDMNELYFRFIKKFIRDIGTPVQLVVLGDTFQGMYEFKGADTRFLTYAPSLWGSEFKRLQLTTSYRVTAPIASFVNEVMLGYPRIQAPKYGHNVLFIRHINPFDLPNIIATRIITLLNEGTLKPDDIFILAASVKSPNSPLKMVENKLVSRGVPCYTPMSETSSIKSNVIKNKVIFASFHQSKGRERKLVIVCGFDQSYFKYYNKTADPSQCPSTLYVAATRATEMLIVIETGDPLPFLKRTHSQINASDYTSFVGVPLGIMRPVSSETDLIQNIRSSPSDLIKFMDESLIVKLADCVESLFVIDPVSYPLNLVSLQGDIESTYKTAYGSHLLCEEVVDINGLAIPAIFEELHRCDKMSEIKRYVQTFYSCAIVKNTDHFIVNQIKTIDFDNMSIPDYLKMTNIYISLNEKLHYKLAQIRHYTWIGDKEVSQIVDNMKRHIVNPGELVYEHTICDDSSNYEKMDAFILSLIDLPIRFTARVDAISCDTVWEFKCVETLELEHLLQVVMYSWIWNMICDEPREFKLMNIRTGEVRVLKYDAAIVNDIMRQIILSKYKTVIPKTDQEFIQHLTC
jgi:hypothetical protein